MNKEEAYRHEKDLISRYRKTGQCKTNIADGGAGGIKMVGEDNPMFGRTWWDENTPQSKIDKWKSSVACKGKDNGMYGVSPKERMSSDKYEIWLQKQNERKKGKSNPNYGNRKLSKIYANDKEYAKAKQGRPGKRNGRCVPVSLYDANMKLISKFDYYLECADYMLSTGMALGKKENIAIQISKHKKSGLPYKGYYVK